MQCPFCSATIPDASELCPHCMSDLRNASPRGDRGTVTDSGAAAQGYVPPRRGYVPPTQPGGHEPPAVAYVVPPQAPPFAGPTAPSAYAPPAAAPPGPYAPGAAPQYVAAAKPAAPAYAPAAPPGAPAYHPAPGAVSDAERQQMQARFTERQQPPPAAAEGRRRTALDGDAAPAQPLQAEGVRGRTRLDREPAGPGAAATPGRRVVGWMISFDVNEEGQEYVIREGRNTLGRARDCDISIFYDEHISSLHATIVTRNGTFKVRDEMTNNGTFINGQDIGPGESAAVKSGDVLRVGRCTFKLFLLDLAEVSQLWPHLRQSPEK